MPAASSGNRLFSFAISGALVVALGCAGGGNGGTSGSGGATTATGGSGAATGGNGAGGSSAGGSPGGGRLYLRFFIRLAAPMTAQHNTFVRGDLYASQGTGNNLLFGEDNFMIYESINGDGQSAMSNNAYYSDGMTIGVNYPVGVWTCVELLLDHDAPAIDVWVDGSEVPDLHQTKWNVDAYDYLRFGFEQYAGPASELWYDDIAIGTRPIGCT